MATHRREQRSDESGRGDERNPGAAWRTDRERLLRRRTLAGSIDKAIPAPSQMDLDQALSKAQEILLGFGVTGVGSMSTSVADWETFRRAGEAHQLNVRLMSYLLGVESMRAVPHPTPWLYQDRLRAIGIKFFADGALGSRGAWLKQPYADKPDTRGLQFHSDSEILRLTDQAAAAGFQIATHAIGDAANAQMISTYEQLHRKYPGDRRWRIEHFQIVDPLDIAAACACGDHRLDAANPPDQRPTDGRETPGSEPARRSLCLADRF